MSNPITNYIQILRSFNRNIQLYLITIGVLGFTFEGGIYAVLFNIYLLRLGYGPEFIGLVNGVGPLVFAVSSLFATVLGNRWGNRRLMVLGYTMMTLGLGLIPMVEFLPAAWQVEWLLTTYALNLLGLSWYFVNAMPFLMATASDETRDHVFSMQIAALFLSGFLGSLFAGWLPGFFANYLGLTLESAVPYRYSLFVSMFLMLPAIFILLAVKEPPNSPSDQVEPKLAGPVKDLTLTKAAAFPMVVILMLTLVRFLQMSGATTITAFFNVYLDDALQVSTFRIGILSALGRLIAVPMALMTPLVIARWGYERVIIWVSYGIFVCLLPLALVPHWGAAGLGLIGVSAINSIRISTIIIFTLALAPRRLHTFTSGLGEMAAG
ncbi:MAG: MFS transporter [Chloroflexota bacterium]